MPELIEVEIPESVSEYIEALAGPSPVGIDGTSDPEFFKLNMEIPKAVPDYKRWIELCSLILREKSKDLRVAGWLAFAFYRTEGIKGLNLGLTVLLHLMKRYGSSLYPQNPAHRLKAVQFIGSPRVINFLEKEPIDKNNIELFRQTQKLIDELTGESKILLGNDQLFKPISEIIATLLNSVPQVTLPSVKEEKKEPVSSAPVIKETVMPAVKTEPEKKTPVQQDQPLVTSENDIITVLRKNIASLFEYEEEGEKKQRVPEFYQVFGMNRIMQWKELVRPPDNGGVTQIEAPNKVIQGLIKDWHVKNETDLLISRVESEFIKENSPFRYWLDAQRFLVLSLESKGGQYKTAAEEIKFQLSVLLGRISDLSQLKFKDKQTPFADQETIDWLNDNVLTITGPGSKNTKQGSSIIVDEVYKDITEEYEKIVNDSADKFESNLSRMQADLDKDERKKGKFLRRLNIADYCFRRKEYKLARILTLELKDFIRENNLSQWEPALCASLWQLHYKINKELIARTKDETLSSNLIAEQEELFYLIAKYNGLLALKLTK